MNWGYIGILIIFALFFLLLIFSPNLSCFGKRVKSPLYPLFRKRKQKKVKTEDYGFSLVNERARPRNDEKTSRVKPESRSAFPHSDVKKRKPGREKNLKTHDYGFSLVDDEDKDKPD